MDEWGTVFDRAIDDEWSCEHNVDSCTTEINTRVEPLPSQFQAGYANDTDPLLAHLLGYADNTETVPSQIPGYADNIGHVDMTPQAPPPRDLGGEGAVGHMAQPQPSASTSTQGVMYGASRSLLQAPVQPSQLQMSRAEAKAFESSDFYSNRHCDCHLQPTASASTLATKDTSMASGGVGNDNNDRHQHSQSTSSDLEAQMQLNISLAKGLISKWENDGDRRGVRRETVWPLRIKWTICSYIEYYFKEVDSSSSQVRMMEDVHEELLKRPDALQYNSYDRFQICVHKMIACYNGIRRDRGNPDTAEYDRESMEEVVEKCGYFFHIHKALSYSEKYKKMKQETDPKSRPAVDDGSRDPTLKLGQRK